LGSMLMATAFPLAMKPGLVVAESLLRAVRFGS
jgi:hypothetical protein